jgi:hypothetical protein
MSAAGGRIDATTGSGARTHLRRHRLIVGPVTVGQPGIIGSRYWRPGSPSCSRWTGTSGRLRRMWSPRRPLALHRRDLRVPARRGVGTRAEAMAKANRTTPALAPPRCRAVRPLTRRPGRGGWLHPALTEVCSSPQSHRDGIGPGRIGSRAGRQGNRAAGWLAIGRRIRTAGGCEARLAYVGRLSRTEPLANNPRFVTFLERFRGPQASMRCGTRLADGRVTLAPSPTATAPVPKSRVARPPRASGMASTTAYRPSSSSTDRQVRRR